MMFNTAIMKNCTYTVGSKKKLTFRNRTYESTDELPTAFHIVVQFVVRFEIQSVLRMCVILYRTRRNFRGVLLTHDRSTCATPIFKLTQISFLL